MAKAYVVLKEWGGHVAGAVVELAEEQKPEELVAQGIVREATPEDTGEAHSKAADEAADEASE